MTTDTVGGVFTYSVTLAAELGRRGATVHLATMGSPLRDSQRAAASAVRGLTIHESTYALEWMNAPWVDVAHAAEWLLEIEHLITPDVVHLNGYCHGSAGFRAPVIVVAHSCVLSWWQAVLHEPAPPSFDRYRVEVAQGIAGAAAVIAPTQWMMRSLGSHYGPLPFSAVVPNGVALPARPPELAKEHEVLAAGRVWDRAKNIEALARVASVFAGPIRVAGPDRLHDGTHRRLPGVELLGFLTPAELWRAMERATIFAHPARYEPFGLAPLEAALRGCALVLGDIESLREVWGDAAVYVDPEDDDALAAALDAFALDDELRRDFAARAGRRAATFSSERMTAGTIAVYEHALGRTRAHAAVGREQLREGVSP
jgi:glycosyltransferase involved in cell wall biosynthesis